MTNEGSGNVSDATLREFVDGQKLFGRYTLVKILGRGGMWNKAAAVRSSTLVYMSPQQLDGERGTHLDDVYSLGATIYDLLTSKPPFYSGNLDRQVRERAAPSMTERRKDLNIEPASVPAMWEEVVAACLAKDPTKRPQSAAEVAQRLQVSASPTRTVSAFSPKGRKRKVLRGAGVAAL